MTEPDGWQNPKTDWVAGDSVDDDDLNRIEGNAEAIENGDRDIDGSSFSLRGFFTEVAERLKAITGKPSWTDAPDVTLEDADAHFQKDSDVHGTGSDHYVARTSNSNQFPHWDEIQGMPEWVDRQVVVYMKDETVEEEHDEDEWYFIHKAVCKKVVIETHSQGYLNFSPTRAGTFILFCSLGIVVTDGSAEYNLRIYENNSGETWDSMERFFLLDQGGMLNVYTERELDGTEDIRFQFRRRETTGDAEVRQGTIVGIAEVV